jgi:hypothetical protein
VQPACRPAIARGQPGRPPLLVAELATHLDEACVLVACPIVIDRAEIEQPRRFIRALEQQRYAGEAARGHSKFVSSAAQHSAATHHQERIVLAGQRTSGSAGQLQPRAQLHPGPPGPGDSRRRPAS